MPYSLVRRPKAVTATSSTLMSTFTVSGILTPCMVVDNTCFYSVNKHCFQFQASISYLYINLTHVWDKSLYNKLFNSEAVSLHFPCSLFTNVQPCYSQKATFGSGYCYHNNIDSGNETFSHK